MTRRTASLSATLALGAALAFAVPAGSAAMEPPAVVYGQPHVEAALNRALADHITVGRLRLELDQRILELRAPGGIGGLTVENLYYSPINGRFAAELTAGVARLPVSGRAFGMVEIPVLATRVAPGDAITPEHLQWIEVRADEAGSDIATTEVQVVGMTPKRGVPVNQPIRTRDVQSPRVVDKGAMVTIHLVTPSMRLSAQGRALEAGGKGEAIRVVNTQSNRIIEVTVAGPNLVTVTKTGFSSH